MCVHCRPLGTTAWHAVVLIIYIYIYVCVCVRYIYVVYIFLTIDVTARWLCMYPAVAFMVFSS